MLFAVTTFAAANLGGKFAATKFCNDESAFHFAAATFVRDLELQKQLWCQTQNCKLTLLQKCGAVILLNLSLKNGLPFLQLHVSVFA